MEIILGVLSFSGFGGTQSYTLTVAEHLEKIGHEVIVYAREVGPMAAFARERGVRVTGNAADLPQRCDALLVQDASMACDLAARYPDAPLVLVVHGAEWVFHLPPQLQGLLGAVVIMNDRVAKRVEALAEPVKIVRLRQPIDAWRFEAKGVARERPERVLLLSNSLAGPRRDLLTVACEDMGMVWTQVGAPGTVSASPEAAILEADIVVGYGRAVLEAMACGRAAYLYDLRSADGWITRETYPALEADGFAGTGQEVVVDKERLRSDLAGYDAGMGMVNRDLLERHHAATDHANALSGLFKELAPRAKGPSEPLREMARLWRLVYQTDARAHELAKENQVLREDVELLKGKVLETNARLDGFRQSRRYRLAELLSRPFELLRRPRRRE